MSLRTAVVGCGSISRKHIEGLHRNADAYRIVGTYDVDRARAEAATEAAAAGPAGKGCRAHADLAALEACRPEVVTIATPSSLHAEQAVYWMERGAHIVLEKPVALCTADIERIAEAQARTGRRIAVGYVLRHAPQIRLVEQALRAERFGRVLHAGLSIYWNRGHEYYRSAPWRGGWATDGGSLMNQATHGIDLLQWILGGRPEWVSGTVARFVRPIEADDFACATVGFAGGGIGTIQATVATFPSNLGTRLTIIGESGTVELTGNGPDAIVAWRFPDDERWRVHDEAVRGGAVPTEDGLMDGHAGVYQDLARALAEGREPAADYASARVSTEIVLGILKSHHTGRTERFPVRFSTAEMAAL